MTNLNEVLNTAVQNGFYTCNRTPGIFYKFTGFGSLRCPAELYDAEGNLVRKELLCVDGIEPREMFEYVPLEQLPTGLRIMSRLGAFRPKSPDPVNGTSNHSCFTRQGEKSGRLVGYAQTQPSGKPQKLVEEEEAAKERARQDLRSCYQG